MILKGGSLRWMPVSSLTWVAAMAQQCLLATKSEMLSCRSNPLTTLGHFLHVENGYRTWAFSTRGCCMCHSGVTQTFTRDGDVKQRQGTFYFYQVNFPTEGRLRPGPSKSLLLRRRAHSKKLQDVKQQNEDHTFQIRR